jgi:hypothetical protein
MYVNDKSYDRLKYFTDVYITKDKYGIVGKKFELTAALTGDLHHYSHYTSPSVDGRHQPHFIGAGGGGAFMHLTHNLPEKLEKLEEKNVQLQKDSFQEESQSWGRDLLFPFKNFTFAYLCFYLMIAWLSQPRHAFGNFRLKIRRTTFSWTFYHHRKTFSRPAGNILALFFHRLFFLRIQKPQAESGGLVSS